MPPRSASSAATSGARAAARAQPGAARAQPGAARAQARPRRVAASLPISKVRWDRKFRTVMVCVLLLVGWIGLKAMLALISTHAEAQHEQALVSSLRRQNRGLARRQQSLSQPATIVRYARELGMVRSGERSYSITGLNGN